MSVFFENIAGNGALKEQISRNIVDNTLSHAYIIEGPAGSGRHTLAYNIAAALSCTGEGSIPCGKCKSCSKILSFKSPDVITVSLEKDRVTMGVETIRGIKEDIVDINGGSTMTLSAVYRLKNIALSDAMAIIEKYLPHNLLCM